MSPQFMATKFPLRPLRLCMVLATTSLPVPDSPCMRTLDGYLAIRLITWSIFDHSMLTPTYSTFTGRLGRLGMAAGSLALTCLPGGLTSMVMAANLFPSGKQMLSLEMISQLKVVLYMVLILQLLCPCALPSSEKQERSSRSTSESAMRAGEPSGLFVLMNLRQSLLAAMMAPVLSISSIGRWARSIIRWQPAMSPSFPSPPAYSSPMNPAVQFTSAIMCSEESPLVTLRAI